MDINCTWLTNHYYDDYNYNGYINPHHYDDCDMMIIVSIHCHIVVTMVSK